MGKIEFFFGSGPGFYKIGDRQIRDGDALIIKWLKGNPSAATARVFNEPWPPGTISSSIGRTRLQIDIILNKAKVCLVEPFGFDAEFCQEADRKKADWAISETEKLIKKAQDHLNELWKVRDDLNKE